MSIHTITKETVVRSYIQIPGPPGEHENAILRAARKDYNRFAHENHLPAEATNVEVSELKYENGHHWRVTIVTTYCDHIPRIIYCRGLK